MNAWKRAGDLPWPGLMIIHFTVRELNHTRYFYLFNCENSVRNIFQDYDESDNLPERLCMLVWNSSLFIQLYSLKRQFCPLFWLRDSDNIYNNSEIVQNVPNEYKG